MLASLVPRGICPLLPVVLDGAGVVLFSLVQVTPPSLEVAWKTRQLPLAPLSLPVYQARYTPPSSTMMPWLCIEPLSPVTFVPRGIPPLIPLVLESIGMALSVLLHRVMAGLETTSNSGASTPGLSQLLLLTASR